MTYDDIQAKAEMAARKKLAEESKALIRSFLTGELTKEQTTEFIKRLKNFDPAEQTTWLFRIQLEKMKLDQEAPGSYPLPGGFDEIIKIVLARCRYYD